MSSALFVFLFLWQIIAISGIRCRQGINCKLPDCFCDTFRHPMRKNNIPQIVYFGFDDAVTIGMAQHYSRLFTPDRKNPNGCPIGMTLYVSHAYTNYGLVRHYYNKGMEIGVHSVTHTQINTRPKILREAREQRDNIVKYAGVPIQKITGWRSPNLATAGDHQPDILQKLGFEYDISLTYRQQMNNGRDPWPFTLDFRGWPYNCQIRPCPVFKHPGFWEIPVVSMSDYKGQYPCPYVDGCYNRAANEDQAFKYLWNNFLENYKGNRAPLGMHMHAAWFFTKHNLKAMDRFIRELLTLEDVYIVTVQQMLEWMKHPTKISELKQFAPWGCGLKTPPTNTTTSTSTTTTTTPKPTTTTTTTPKPTTTTTTTPKPTTTTTTTPKPTTTTTTTTPKPTTTTTTPKPKTTTPKPTTTTTTTITTPKSTTTTSSTTKRTFPPFTPTTEKPTPRPQIPQPIPADQCIQGRNCHLPNCYCRSRNTPGNLKREEIPQMVYISFDGNVNDIRKYESIFYGRLNPNKCPAAGTFFVTQFGSIRYNIKRLQLNGHEIAMRGYVNRRILDESTLSREIERQKSDMLQTGIEDIVGWRSPELKPLGNQQFDELYKHDILYDASLVKQRDFFKSKLWPFTLDYGWNEGCVIPECPNLAYPGIWEFPTNPLIDYKKLYQCTYADGCMFSPPTARDTFNFLWNNFIQHYHANKAPFGINLRHIWFSHFFYDKNLTGLKMFLDKLGELDDVYIVPIRKIIDWMKNPTSLSKLKHFQPWQC